MYRRAALLVVDVQRDFCPGGALAVPEGDAIIPVLNRYLALFEERSSPIFASRDWHPADSAHFSSQGGSWPPHCIQGSDGALFHPQLLLPDGTIVISKGTTRWDEGYSAFQGTTANGTPFPMLLRHMGLDRLYVGGLATDYCVRASVLEGLQDGFALTVLADAVRAVEREPGDGERALEEMRSAGASFVTVDTIARQFSADSNE